MNWLKNGVVRKVGNCRYTRFWMEKWVGNSLHCEVFILSLSFHKEAIVFGDSFGF